MKKFLILSLSLIILSACTQSETNKEALEPSIESLNSVFNVPIDSLSVEQKREMLELFKIMEEKLELVDGNLVVNTTEKDFEDKGINLYYFSMLNKSMSDMNTFIKNDNVENGGLNDIEEIFIEMKEKLKEGIENLSH